MKEKFCWSNEVHSPESKSLGKVYCTSAVSRRIYINTFALNLELVVHSFVTFIRFRIFCSVFLELIFSLFCYFFSMFLFLLYITCSSFLFVVVPDFYAASKSHNSLVLSIYLFFSNGSIVSIEFSLTALERVCVCVDAGKKCIPRRKTHVFSQHHVFRYLNLCIKQKQSKSNWENCFSFIFF